MPYKLRISEEEVRAELEKMGFTSIPDETVEVFRRDLLKLIKSDLRKLKQDKQLLEGSREETTYFSPPATIGRHGHAREKAKRPEASTPLSPRRPASSSRLSSKDSKHLNTDRVLSVSDEDTAIESGYSDFESESSRPSYSSEEVDDSSSSIYLISRNGQAGARSQPVDPSAKRGAFPSSRRESKDSAEDSHRGSQESAFDSHKVTEDSSVDSHRGFKDSAVAPSRSIAKEKQEVAVRPKKKVVKAADSLPGYPSRPDPVNLYHFYKAHWDKFKTPGEDPRSKLRWEVRTKLFYSS
ncbi:uncharacterized protein LOC122256862 isoform X2 [Penaeus japonicus]|uniref:uncharacterized protein LOC122256862 isoform X2 n=1 Tax=Penaeus japonicus TaxID=27405 RepID=UPI001C7110DB|nr:uncharacterized protein LOC122256862 isoform X2 [Penaeus japonicus]